MAIKNLVPSAEVYSTPFAAGYQSPDSGLLRLWRSNVAVLNSRDIRGRAAWPGPLH